jgi:hypothetical protein
MSAAEQSARMRAAELSARMRDIVREEIRASDELHANYRAQMRRSVTVSSAIGAACGYFTAVALHYAFFVVTEWFAR